MKHWYAIYIRPRAEKKAKFLLEEKGIDCYLPLKKTLRQWSDRKKWVELPVISGYIFVHIEMKERLEVLQTDFVLAFVTWLGQYAVIPDEQITAMKQMLGQEVYRVETDFEKYHINQEVRVISGPLTGMKGFLVKVKNRKKIMIRIDHIQVNMMVEVPAAHIEVLHKKAPVQ
jgi:transcription antitermination factor NusG